MAGSMSVMREGKKTLPLNGQSHNAGTAAFPTSSKITFITSKELLTNPRKPCVRKSKKPERC